MEEVSSSPSNDFPNSQQPLFSDHQDSGAEDDNSSFESYSDDYSSNTDEEQDIESLVQDMYFYIVKRILCQLKNEPYATLQRDATVTVEDKRWITEEGLYIVKTPDKFYYIKYAIDPDILNNEHRIHRHTVLYGHEVLQDNCLRAGQ